MFRTTIAGIVLLSVAFAVDAKPTLDEMYELIQKQAAEIASLKDGLAENNAKTESTFTAVEESTSSPTAKLAEWATKTTMGGYGELHYNSLRDQKGDNNKDQMDFHRFVLFVNHEFNDKMRFVSELELEHSLSGDGKPGEVELEQAYIQYDLTAKTSITGGLFLTPVGIMNETHEPPTFYGVERNDVEKNIIPTTWWEGGAMVEHEFIDGLTANLSATSGLDSDGGTFTPRGARQKVAEAEAKTFAYNGRLKYTAIPGLQLAGTINYQYNFCQNEIAGCGSATLYEAHTVYNKDNFGLRALVAWWDIDGSAVSAVGADEQYGYYVEPSYRFDDAIVAGQDIGVFARYAVWDNQEGSGSTTDTEYQQVNFGANWWIDKDVVVKIDYQLQDVGDGVSKEMDGINLGVGYQF